MRCNLRLLNISYKDQITNEEVRRKIQADIGEYDELLTDTNMVWPRHKIFWFSKDNPTGHNERKRRRGREKKKWEENIKDWTGMDFASSTMAAENMPRRKWIITNASVPRRTSKVMGLN